MIRTITEFLVPVCGASTAEIAAYCRDIDKIVLDKGLLAIIAGLVTTILTWRLEAFKSRLKRDEERRRLELASVQGLFDRVESIAGNIERHLGYIAEQFHADTAILIRLLDSAREAYRDAGLYERAHGDLDTLRTWVSARIQPVLTDHGLAEMAGALDNLGKDGARHFWESARLYLEEFDSETLRQFSVSGIYLVVANEVFPRCALRHRAEIDRQCETFTDLVLRFLPRRYEASERLMHTFTAHIRDWTSKFPDPFFNYSVEGLRVLIHDRMGPINRGMQFALREIASGETNTRRFRRYVRQMKRALS
jgi:hypothetical protein